MFSPDDGCENDSLSRPAGPTNYNSEWDKFVLLIWKNIRLMWSNWQYVIISIISPIIFCTILISLRISGHIEKQPIENYPILDLSKYWIDLLHLIDERKANISRRIEGFTHSPFIPQRIVGYAPNSVGFSRIMKGTRKHLKSMVVKGYETCDLLRLAIIEEDLLAGVCFDMDHHSHEHTFHKDDEDEIYELIGGLFPNYLKYHLIFPYACRIYHDTFIGINWQTNSLYHFINRTDQRNIGQDDGGYVGYIREGFAPLQNAIGLSYLQLVADVEKPEFRMPSIYMCRYPSKEFLKDNVIESIDFSLSLMILFGNLYPVLMFVATIVDEKENKLKIYSKIMGINNYVHSLGWMVDALQRSLISSLIVVTLLKIKWIAGGVAVFEQSGFFALLIVIAVYNMTSICFILMLATFHTQTVSAVTGTAIVWFLTYVPYILSLSDIRLTVWKNNIFVVIFHNTALGFTLENIMEFELFGRGFNFENFFDTRPLDNTASIGSYLGIMLMQCCVYTAISLYVEELVPGNFGLAKRWNFLFTNKKRTSLKLGVKRPTATLSLGSDASGVVGVRPTPFIYEVAGDGNVVLVDIQNVSKNYENEVVLRNISLQLHENEITILLGHNGAGKTTLLAMISGLITITSGSITIDGFDVHKDQRYACASMGLSMADTVLYPDLTVEDQLRFFSYLKGFESLAVEREVERYLNSTKLLDYRLEYTKNLPLGIRQQLAICCALTGQSRVVLLDDPTTQMDLPARTLMWKLLEREKSNRTILITSSSSNVLEGVGDRVAIISNGELQCDGTPIFIKKMYGHGYRLIITKGPQCRIHTVTNRVRQYIANIEPLSTLGNELIYALEENHADVFDQLTSDLEHHMFSLSIETVALRSIQIDDIFFQLGSASPSHENRARLMEIMNGESIYPEDNKHLRFMEITKRLRGLPRVLQQWRALWRQRFLYDRHHRVHCLQRLLYPPIFVVMAFFVSAFSLSRMQMADIDISLDQYASSVTLIDRRQMARGGGEVSDILDRYKELIFWLGIQHKLEETEGQLFGDYYIEKDVETLERLDQDHHVGVTFGDEYIVAWFNNVALHSVPLSLNLVHNAILRTIHGDQCGIEITMEPLNNMQNHLDSLLRVTVNTSHVLALCLSVCMCCLWNSNIFIFVREIRFGYANTQLLAGAKIWIYWLVNISYDSLIITCMALLATLAILLCQYHINVATHIYGWYIVVLVLAGCCIYSLNYMISLYFTNPVHAYAIALSFEAFGIMCFCHVIEAFEKGYVNTAKSPYAIYFICLPMFAACSALSTVYYNAEFLRVCSDEHIRTTSIYLENCKAIPNCCRQYNMLSFNNGILLEMLALLLTLLLCWWIILVTDYRYMFHFKDTPRDDYYAQLNDHKRRHDQLEESRFGEESAFMEHYAVQRLNNVELRETPLVCDRVGKNFGQDTTTVDRLSLILNKYDCFGILGVSGCGLTTLFKLITGFAKLSYGRILVKGRDVSCNFSLVQQLVGHGKQEMINFPELTIENVMEFMCGLHGYPSHTVFEICVNLAKVLGLFPHYHKHLNILSAGILNRLNCALAIMGNPEMLMLDMATAGIDSAGKRKVWNVLKRMQTNGTTILNATISLRDCERFCSRVGFMSHGRLCLIGKPWNLDKLYADNHLLKVKFSRSLIHTRGSMTSNYLYAASLNKLTDFVCSQFPNAVLKEHRGNKFLFLIPVYSTTISNIYTTMMRNAYPLNIEDFELTRCSLSQSFIEFWEREYRLKRHGDPLSLRKPANYNPPL